VGDGIAQLAAFVNRTGSFRGNVARDPSWKGKLFEEFAETFFGLRNVRIDLALGSFKIGVGNEAGTAMSGTSDVNDIEIVKLDEAI